MPANWSFPANTALLQILDALHPDADDEQPFLCELHPVPHTPGSMGWTPGAKLMKDLFCVDCRRVCCSDCVIFGVHRLHTIHRASRLSGSVLQSINLQARAVLDEMAGLEEQLKVLFAPASLSCTRI
jgi:hypothetical protein